MNEGCFLIGVKTFRCELVSFQRVETLEHLGHGSNSMKVGGKMDKCVSLPFHGTFDTLQSQNTPKMFRCKKTFLYFISLTSYSHLHTQIASGFKAHQHVLRKLSIIKDGPKNNKMCGDPAQLPNGMLCSCESTFENVSRIP